MSTCSSPARCQPEHAEKIMYKPFIKRISDATPHTIYLSLLLRALMTTMNNYTCQPQLSNRQIIKRYHHFPLINDSSVKGGLINLITVN